MNICSNFEYTHSIEFNFSEEKHQYCIYYSISIKRKIKIVAVVQLKIKLPSQN